MLFFFFNDTATTEIYTLSLHDALPICVAPMSDTARQKWEYATIPLLVHNTKAILDSWGVDGWELVTVDRKSTRLNSSHANISYAVFCLKKKNNRLSTRKSSSSKIN